MIWTYVPCKCTEKYDTYYCVKEAYRDKDGTNISFTSDMVSPMGSTKAELIQDLERMLVDCKNNKVVCEQGEI